MSLHVSSIKIEIWDSSSDLPFHAHINYSGNINIYDHEYNEVDSDSLIGNRLLLVVVEQLEAFSAQPDINMIGLN